MATGWSLFTWTWRISHRISPWTYFNVSSFTIPSKLFFPDSSVNTKLLISCHIHLIAPVSPMSVNVTNIYIVAKVTDLKVFYYSVLFLISWSSENPFCSDSKNETESDSHLVVCNSLRPHGQGPLSMEFSRQEYWSDYPSRSSQPEDWTLHYRQILYHLNHQGSPWVPQCNSKPYRKVLKDSNLAK